MRGAATPKSRAGGSTGSPTPGPRSWRGWATTGSSPAAATGGRACRPVSAFSTRTAPRACSSSHRSSRHPRTAPNLTERERNSLDDLTERDATGSAYSSLHATRPQTIGYALTDSPVGLAAWIVEKVWSWSDHDGDLDAVDPRDRVLDNVSLYWFTRTAASSARLYRESIGEVSTWFDSASAHRPAFTRRRPDRSPGLPGRGADGRRGGGRRTASRGSCTGRNRTAAAISAPGSSRRPSSERAARLRSHARLTRPRVSPTANVSRPDSTTGTGP